jgi:hypothetical protein
VQPGAGSAARIYDLPAATSAGSGAFAAITASIMESHPQAWIALPEC